MAGGHTRSGDTAAVADFNGGKYLRCRSLNGIHAGIHSGGDVDVQKCEVVQLCCQGLATARKTPTAVLDNHM